MTKQKEKKLKVKLEEKTKKETQLSEEELEGVAGGGGNIIDSFGSEFAMPINPNTVKIKR